MPNKVVSVIVVLAVVAGAGCSSGGGGTTGAAGTTGSAGTTGAAGTTGSAGTTGGGGTMGGGGPVTTLDATKAVNALSAAEKTQLCNDSYAYFGTAIPKATTCKWRGLAYGASSSAPTEAKLRDNCAGKETSCQGLDPWADNLGCSGIPSTCTATVAEYAACISDEVAAFIQTVNGLPVCSALTQADTSQIVEAQTGTPPAGCMTLMNTCPDLYPPSPLNI